MQSNGLEGIVVADTKLSDVDGEAGRLVIAGANVEALAGAVSFDEVCSRLLGYTPKLGEARERAFELLPRLADALSMNNGMDALRASVARLESPSADDIIGAVAVFGAAWSRTHEGKRPVAPDARLGQAGDYLRMVLGSEPSPWVARAIDAYFVTVVDHGMNASTFAARVIASTEADLASAVTGAIGALKGPLHGGAPGPVLDMLDAIGSPDRAEAWIREEIGAGRRIMGMGHRIYRVRDPRAAVLEREVRELEKAGVRGNRLALASAVERSAEKVLASRHASRPLRANVEFYTAVLLEAVGIPRAAFSPTFAASRVAGWCAHVAEQRATGRLIRPASRYVGQVPPR